MIKNTRIYGYLIFGLVLMSCNSNSTEDKNPRIDTLDWQAFDQEIFSKTTDSKKYVLLDIGANWCHWCHVMDDSTFADQTVKDYIGNNFVLAKADQDKRPDLYAKYKKWGWPALIVFNAEGEEILKLKGYQEKTKFIRTLKATVADPQKIVSEKSNSNFSDPTAEKVSENFISKLDFEKGGYNWNHKLLDYEGVKYAISKYHQDSSLKNWLDMTIGNSYHLIDQTWSGVYQYSTKKEWTNPHFEKLLRVQAAYIELYTHYYGITGDTSALSAAKGIYNYCERFLRSEKNLYYNSQNADLNPGEHAGDYYQLNEKDRLVQGVPSVDQSIFLKENAAMIKALLYLHIATGDDQYAIQSSQMIDYILTNHQAKNGLFKREINNEEIFSFADNSQFLEALILAARISDEHLYRKECKLLAENIENNFSTKKGHISAIGNLALPAPIISLDNLKYILSLEQLALLLTDEKWNKIAKTSFKKIENRGIENAAPILSSTLMARSLLFQDPYHALHIIDDTKEMRKSSKLYTKDFILSTLSYVTVENLVKGEMTGENELYYGSADAGTLFICTSSYCSSPITSASGLNKFLADI